MFLAATELTSVSGLLVLTALVGGCDRGDARNGQPDRLAPAHAASSWLKADHSAFVAVDDALIQQDLREASEQARATAAEAHARWAVASAEDRGRWAIKWAAPAASSASADRAPAVEHVWVVPLTWSAFRIEGVLSSGPINELAGGHRQGDLVSFPIEEMSDWIHFTDGEVSSSGPASTDPHGAVEGGFTIKVLEARFGRPPA